VKKLLVALDGCPARAVAANVVDHADRPVLVVRAPERLGLSR
jgi:hypothetical protein